MTIEFGWVLPTANARMPAGTGADYLPHVERIVALLADSFTSLWIPDHFMFGQSDVPEAMTTLSFMAGKYPALDVGALVLGQSYRNPALLAKMAATLQNLSGGRFILGIGAGWKEDEYRAYGYEFPPARVRIAQLAETVQICKALWDPAQAEVTFHGQHYQLQAAICNPKPLPPPPIMIGGAGEKLMLRIIAEQAEWWNLVGASAEVYAHKIEVLARHCAAVGRDPATIRRTWAGTVSIAASRQEAKENIESFPLWPGDIPLLGTPQDVRAQIQRYIDLGVDYFMLGFADEPATAGIELFVKEVIPFFTSTRASHSGKVST